MDSSRNQDQATDQEELNPQEDDAIGLQASKDDPLTNLFILAQLPEPQPNITTAPSAQALPTQALSIQALSVQTLSKQALSTQALFTTALSTQAPPV